MALTDLILTSSAHGEPPTVLALRDVIDHLAALKDYAGRKVFADGWVRTWEDSLKTVTGDVACIITTPSEQFVQETIPPSFMVTGFMPVSLWLYYSVAPGVEYREARERLVRFILRALSYPVAAGAADAVDAQTVYSQPDATAADFGFKHREAYWSWATQTITVGHDEPTAPVKPSDGWHVTEIPLALEFMANAELAE